jgi:hypothetical protein
VLVPGNDALAPLEIGRLFSSALVEIVHSIETTPAWMVTKGGVTPSNIAIQRLDVFRAEVLGQILPDVLMWCTAAESRWLGLVYVIFPGNTGDPRALVKVVKALIIREYSRNRGYCPAWRRIVVKASALEIIYYPKQIQRPY